VKLSFLIQSRMSNICLVKFCTTVSQGLSQRSIKWSHANFLGCGGKTFWGIEEQLRRLPEFILYFSPEVAFEVVNYCCEHTKKLQQSTNIFSKYFPNIFKVLAWFPRTFLREFMELLPAMISEKTYMEVSPHSSVFCSVHLDETRMRVHESWKSRDLGQLFKILSCHVF
jgi:hypothetical protein